MTKKTLSSLFTSPRNYHEAYTRAIKWRGDTSKPQLSDELIDMVGNPYLYNYILSSLTKTGIGRPDIDMEYLRNAMNDPEFLAQVDEKEVKSNSYKSLRKAYGISSTHDDGTLKPKRQIRREIENRAIHEGFFSKKQAEGIYKQRSDAKKKIARERQAKDKDRDLQRRRSNVEVIEPSASLMDYSLKKIESKLITEKKNPPRRKSKKSVVPSSKKETPEEREVRLARKEANKAKTLQMIENRKANRSRRREKRLEERRWEKLAKQVEETWTINTQAGDEFLENEDESIFSNLSSFKQMMHIDFIAELCAFMYDIYRIKSLPDILIVMYRAIRLFGLEVSECIDIVKDKFISFYNQFSSKLGEDNRIIDHMTNTEDSFSIYARSDEKSESWDSDPMAKTQGGFLDDIDLVIARMETLIDSDLGKAIGCLITGLAAMSIIGNDVAEKAFGIFHRPSKKLPMFAIIGISVAVMIKLFRFGKAYIQGDKSFMDILTASDPIKAASVKASSFLARAKNTYVGTKIEGYECRVAFCKELGSFLESSSAFDKYPGIYSCVQSLRSMIADLKIVHYKLVQTLQTTRQMPFSFVLTGAPGIGKTNIRLLLIRSIFRAADMKFSEHEVYTKAMDSEYWDGLTSSHKVIFLPELANQSTAIAKRETVSAMAVFNRLVDTAPFNANMSEANMKGTVYPHPILVVGETNNPGLHLKEQVYSTSAIQRRILYIDVQVKTKYRIDGTAQIDFAKSTRDIDSNMLDRYAFKFYTYVALSSSQSQQKVLAENIDVYDAVKLISDLYKDHVSKQTRMKNLDTEYEDILKKVFDSDTSDDDDDSIVDAREIEIESVSTGSTMRLAASDEGSSISEERKIEEYSLFSDDDFSTIASIDVQSGPEEKEKDYANSQIVKWNSDYAKFMLKWKSLNRFQKMYWAIFENPLIMVVTLAIILMNVLMEELLRFFFPIIGTVVWILCEFAARRFVPALCHIICMLFVLYIPGGFIIAIIFHIIWNFVVTLYVLGARDDMQEISWNSFQKHNYASVLVNVFCYGVEYAQVFVMRTILKFVILREDEKKYLSNSSWLNLGTLASCLVTMFVISCSSIYMILHHTLVTLILIFIIFSFLVSVVLSFDYKKLRLYAREKVSFITKMKLEKEIKIMDESLSIGNFLGHMRPKSIFGESYIPTALAMLCVAGGLSYFFIKNKKGSKKQTDVLPQAGITEMEDKMGAWDGLFRRKVSDTNSWNEISLCTIDSIHKGTPQELSEFVKKNTFRIVYSVDEKLKFVHGISLCKSYILLNRHAAKVATKFYLKFSGNKAATEENLDACQPYESSSIVYEDEALDLAILDVSPMNVANVLKHFGDHDGSIKVGSGMIDDKLIKFVVEPATFNDPNLGIFSISKCLKYTVHNYPGMCGKPLIAQTGSSSSAIIGFHTGGVQETGYSVLVSRSQIEKALCMIKKDNLMPITTQGSICIETERPGIKSQSLYLYMPHLHLFGKVKDRSVTFPKKSTLVRTPFYNELPSFFEENFNFTRTEQYGPPVMKPFVRDGEYIDPYRNTLIKLNNNPPRMNRKVMNKVVVYLTNKIVKMFKDHGITKLCPLTAHSAINGARDDDFVKRINASTSSGFGFPGVKSKHLQIFDGDGNRKMTEELEQAVVQEFLRYASGETVRPIYTGQLKDEPRLHSKVLKGATRMFYMSPLPNLILGRMLMGTFISSMCDFGREIGIQVGIDMHSDADRYVKSFLNHRGIEGDYSGYDVHRSVDLQWMVNSIIYNVHMKLGYNKSALNALRGYLTDDIHPVIMILGELYCKPGSQMSGKYGTAEQNSLANKCIFTYIWFDNENTRDLDIELHSQILSYGDDIQVPLSDYVIDNHIMDNHIFAREVKRTTGMVFTSASKDAEMERVTDLVRGSFLKRTFHFNEEVSKWHARLDLNSCFKALEWYLPSKHVIPEDQMIGCAQSMCWEFYFWANDHNHYVSIVQNLAKLYEEYLSIPVESFVSFMPHFYDIRNRVDTPLIYNHETKDDCFDEKYESVESQSGYLTSFEDFDSKENLNIQTPLVCVDESAVNQRHADNSIFSQICCHKARLSQIEEENKEDLSIYELRKNKNIPDRIQRIRHLEEKANIEETIKCLRRSQNIANTQSGASEAVSGEISSRVEEKHEILRDVGGNELHQVYESNSRYIDNGQMTMNDLDDFFLRPVEIANFSLPIGTPVSNIYDVWDLYTLDPTVRSKLRNYAYLNADLHVRIAVTGTPFHYGRLLVSYQPYPLRNANLLAFDDAIAVDPNFRAGLLTYLSQSREACVIDIKNNEPVEMCLPFISTKQAHRLYNDATTVISDITSYEDLRDAGSLYVYTLNTAQSASPSPGPVTVQIYAWLENVQLGCSTATIVSIATQAGDERIKGPVEKFSSAAQKVSMALENVPMIGPFAKASTYVFRGMEGVSSIFGWSKPVCVDDHKYVKNEAYPNGNLTVGKSVAHRFVFDPLQETSLGNEIVGVPEDELVIQTFASKEAYVHTLSWTPTATIMADPIFLMRVSPNIGNVVVSDSRAYIFPSPMCYASSFFERWRGTINVRFEFVCSAYHRGKIAVYYEPNISQAALINANLSLNKNQMFIIDLQETQNVAFCINWNAMRPTLLCSARSNVITNLQAFSPTVNAINYVNGYIGLVPFTELSSPDDSEIQINVYVSCDDLEVCVPFDGNTPLERHIPTQAGEVKDGIGYSCIDLNVSSANTDRLYDQYFGERVVSFRQMMKRYCIQESTEVGPGLIGDKAVSIVRSILPFQHLKYGDTNSNVNNLITELQYAFLGIRGSVRRRIRFIVPRESIGIMTAIVVNRRGRSHSTSTGWRTNVLYAYMNGGLLFAPSTNAGVEFEMPYYSPNLLDFAFADDHVGQNNATGDMQTPWVSTYGVTMDLDPSISPLYIEEICAGEDFNLLRFQGCPFYSYTI